MVLELYFAGHGSRLKMRMHTGWNITHIKLLKS